MKCSRTVAVKHGAAVNAFTRAKNPPSLCSSCTFSHLVHLDLHGRMQCATVCIMNSHKPTSQLADNSPPPYFSQTPTLLPTMKVSHHPEMCIYHSLVFKKWFYHIYGCLNNGWFCFTWFRILFKKKKKKNVTLCGRLRCAFPLIRLSRFVPVVAQSYASFISTAL